MTKLLIALLFLSALAACNKGANPEPIAPGTWAVSGATYRMVSVSRGTYRAVNFGDTLHFVAFHSAANTNTLMLSFTAPPVAGRSYRIVDQPDSSNEVSVAMDTRTNSNDEPEQYLHTSSAGSQIRYIATDIELQHHTFVVDSYPTASLNVSD